MNEANLAIGQSIKVPNKRHRAQASLIDCSPFNGTKALPFYDAISPLSLSLLRVLVVEDDVMVLL